MNSLYSFSDAKCVYISILNSSDSFIFKVFFNSMFNMFKSIDIKAFSKSIEGSICFVITILHFVFVILAFF